MTVIRYQDETIDNLIKRFNSQVAQGKILKELKAKQFYTKPSTTERLKRTMKLAKSRLETTRYKEKIARQS